MNEADRTISVDRVSSRSAVREDSCLAFEKVRRNGASTAGKDTGYRTHTKPLIGDIPEIRVRPGLQPTFAQRLRSRD